jgi:hypothetical protein
MKKNEIPYYPDFAIDCVQDIVETSNSIFHRFESDNFKGINAFVEIIVNEKPANQSFGVFIISEKEVFNQTDTFYYIDITNFQDYFKNFELPILGIVINKETYEGFWTDLKNSIDSNGYLKISKRKEFIFNYKTFNTIVIDYIINQKKTYFLIEEYLLNSDNIIIKEFIEVLFRIIDFGIQYIIENDNITNFAKSVNVNIKILNVPLTVAINSGIMNEDGPILINNGNGLWYIKTDKDNVYMTGLMFFHLQAKYVEIKKIQLNKL